MLQAKCDVKKAIKAMAMTSVYDREEEVKWFDETKAGVKGLVDSGLTTIPRMFVTSSDNVDTVTADDVGLELPVIDLKGMDRVDSVRRKVIIDKVRSASETWGFFRLVNHGIPAHVLDEMIAGVRRFFEQPHEVKSQYYTRDYSNKLIYHSNFDLFKTTAANWKDSFVTTMAPDPVNPENLPLAFRDVLIDYCQHVTKLGTTVFELISEALGLPPSHLKNMNCDEGLLVAGHYYPPCPEPELTLGASKHSDLAFLTILLEDQIGGLQFLYQDCWVDVAPIYGSLLVNIGDFLQLVSNDRFKSSEHRVISKNEGPRMSLACFFRPQQSSELYGPINELISKENPPVYRETTIQDYVGYYIATQYDGSTTLSHFTL